MAGCPTSFDHRWCLPQQRSSKLLGQQAEVQRLLQMAESGTAGAAAGAEGRREDVGAPHQHEMEGRQMVAKYFCRENARVRARVGCMSGIDAQTGQL